MRSVDEHLRACLAVARPPAPRLVELDDLLDAVLAEDVTSPVDLPPFDNSAMDGYAVRVADLAGAGEASPVVLPVALDLPAGARGGVAVPPAAVARIMTGAPVPPGTDAVVPVEWTDAGAQKVAVRRAPSVGQYVRPAGEDVRRGEVVVPAGTRLTPRHVALLAAVGRREVRAVPPPRVAVVSTGSELARPGEPLQPGQVYESNAYGLVAACRELGADAYRVGPVTDDAATLAGVLRGLAGTVDLVLTSGGVSAGAYEPVKQVFSGGLAEDGPPGQVEFAKVAMQPGMPQGVGELTGEDGVRTPIVTLPGNPVSSLVSFEVFVRPMLGKMRGEPEARWSRPEVEAVALESWSSAPGKRQFVRGLLGAGPGGEAGGEAGGRTVAPLGRSGSHLVAALSKATCLVVVPEEVTRVERGDRLRCMVLDRATP